VPYVEVRAGLLARLSRPVYYDMIGNLAEETPDGRCVVRSRGAVFELPS
jgi:hypothetical protein